MLLIVLTWAPALGAMYATPSRLGRDWRQAMQYLSAEAAPGDAVAFRGGQGSHAYWYYYQGPALETIRLAPEADPEDLAAQADGTRRVWLVLWDPTEQCQIPESFAPGAGDALQISDAACFPQAQILTYTWRRSD